MIFFFNVTSTSNWNPRCHEQTLNIKHTTMGLENSQELGPKERSIQIIYGRKQWDSFTATWESWGVNFKLSRSELKEAIPFVCDLNKFFCQSRWNFIVAAVKHLSAPEVHREWIPQTLILWYTTGHINNQQVLVAYAVNVLAHSLIGVSWLKLDADRFKKSPQLHS